MGKLLSEVTLLKKFIFTIAFCFLPLSSWAVPETFEIKVSVFQQSCNRGDATKPYACKSSQVNDTKTQITLVPVKPFDLEDEGYSGESGDFWTSVPSEGQFILNAFIHKSIAFGGKSIIYEFKFSAQKYSNSPTSTFSVRASSNNKLSLPLPLILIADRYEPNERYFTQVFYKIELVNP